MRALVQSYPPLGQVTVVQTSQQPLTVVLEVSADREREPWEASVWMSVDEEKWHEVKLGRMEDHLKPRMLQELPAGSTSLYFSGQLSLQKSAKFTIKFRPSSDRAWRWVQDEDGLGDGTISLQSPARHPDSCSRLQIPDLNSQWTVTSETSQSPGTRLWSLRCPIEASAGNDSVIRAVDIGTPWGSFLRWFALVRHQSAWLGPRQGSSRFMVDEDAILCCFLSCEGQTMAMLAVSGIDNMAATFSGNTKNNISVNARNDSLSTGTINILISEGPRFDNTVASVMYEARKLVSPHAVSRVDDVGTFGGTHAQATARWEAEWYDGLGFCTWNSLGQQLSETKLLDAIQELAQNEIHITNLIIDDNWQSLDRAGHDQSQHGWAEFEADKHAFPSGLKSLVSSIRRLHPEVRHVLVWHALLGYWGGISPNGVIAATYKTSNVAQSSKDHQSSLTVVAKEDVARFYDDFYTFLIASGIDGVKTDVQVMLDSFTEATDRRDLILTYLDEWSKASRKHFGGKIMSCMSQFPQSLFHSQLPRSDLERIVRNSDDYFPDEPASHPWHVWANAHNAIFTRYLNVVPDWDMFQSVHGHSGFHAAARCVSGGPIYITDVPGEHNMPLIKQMTALTPLGRTIILRPSSLGRAIHHYESYDGGSLLKIGSYHGASQAGTGILGVFNVSTRRVNELLPLEYFPGILSSIEYVIRAHTTGKLSGLMSTARPASLISVSLDVQEYEILCALPVTSFEGCKYVDGHAGVVGLTTKMTGCAALNAVSILKLRAGRVDLVCSLRALGVLGVFVSILPSMTFEDDLMVTIEDVPVPVETVGQSETDPRVLDIDVERAWKELALTTCSPRRDEITVRCTLNV